MEPFTFFIVCLLAFGNTAVIHKQGVQIKDLQQKVGVQNGK